MAKSRKRTKRKIVGHRHASTGEYVTADFANEHPDITVAVTKEEPSAQRSFDEYVDAVYREQDKDDKECT